MQLGDNGLLPLSYIDMLLHVCCRCHRIFNIAAEGSLKIADLEIYSQTAPCPALHTAYNSTFTVLVSTQDALHAMQRRLHAWFVPESSLHGSSVTTIHAQ